MGIKTKTTTIVTCDLCGSSCEMDGGVIDFAINGGDGRDVGPTRIQGRITLYQPYGCSAGLLCRACTNHHLRRYLDNAARGGGDYPKASQDYLQAWRSDMQGAQELRDRITALETALSDCLRHLHTAGSPDGLVAQVNGELILEGKTTRNPEDIIREARSTEY